MGKPQSAGKLMSSGGALQTDPDRATLCKAFYEAVKDFCGQGPGTPSLGSNRSFNDYFSKHLQGDKPLGAAIAQNIEREVPFLMQSTSEGRKVVGRIQDLATGPDSEAQQIASAIWTKMLGTGTATLTAAGSVSGAGNAIVDAVHAGWKDIASKLFKPKTWGRFETGFLPRTPDGIYKGKAFEIKGPKDRLSGRQAADARRIGGGQEPYVVSCKSCSVKPCSGGCPKPKKDGTTTPITQGTLP